MAGISGNMVKIDDKELKKAMKAWDKEQEDIAWAKKKAIYGRNFNEKKFYELEAFWPNFWAWMYLLPFLLLILAVIWKKYTSYL